MQAMEKYNLLTSKNEINIFKVNIQYIEETKLLIYIYEIFVYTCIEHFSQKILERLLHCHYFRFRIKIK